MRTGIFALIATLLSFSPAAAQFVLVGVNHTRATALGVDGQLGTQRGKTVLTDWNVSSHKHITTHIGFSGYESTSGRILAGQRTDMELEVFTLHYSGRMWTPPAQLRGFVDAGVAGWYIKYYTTGPIADTEFVRPADSTLKAGVHVAFGVRLAVWKKWGLQGMAAYTHTPPWYGINPSHYSLTAGIGYSR